MRGALKTMTCCVLLSGCAAEPSPAAGQRVTPKASATPEDVKQIEMSVAAERYTSVNWVVDKLTVADIGSSSPTTADRANGIKDKYCVTVAFILRERRYTTWKDRHQTVSVVQTQNGWEGTTYGDSAGLSAINDLNRCISGRPPA